MYMVNWFAKTLEDCSTGEKNEFYATSWDGSRSFMTRRCTNANGHQMAPMDYGGGGKRNFVFIPEGMEGMGWKKLVFALREICVSLEVMWA